MVAIIFIFVCILFFIFIDLRLKKRFGRHRIVQKIVNALSEAMMKKILKSSAPDYVRFLVVSEWAKITDENIFCEQDSVYFSREHMCLLRTSREKKLMAFAIAEQTKKRVIAECSSLEELKGKKFHVTIKCEGVFRNSQKCFFRNNAKNFFEKMENFPLYR